MSHTPIRPEIPLADAFNALTYYYSFAEHYETQALAGSDEEHRAMNLFSGDRDETQDVLDQELPDIYKEGAIDPNTEWHHAKKNALDLLHLLTDEDKRKYLVMTGANYNKWISFCEDVLAYQPRESNEVQSCLRCGVRLQ